MSDSDVVADYLDPSHVRPEDHEAFRLFVTHCVKNRELFGEFVRVETI